MSSPRALAAVIVGVFGIIIGTVMGLTAERVGGRVAGWVLALLMLVSLIRYLIKDFRLQRRRE